MAVGDGELGTIYPVKGFRLGVASAGIKKPGRKDLVVMALAEGSHIAAVFTRNAFCAAPVQLAKTYLASAQAEGLAIRYLVTNTGNANAGTGAVGLADATAVCQRVAEITGVKACQVLPFSTGVIGEALPTQKIAEALPAAVSALSEQAWLDAALGIMTTDTRPKAASRQIIVAGTTVTISGITKGAGMIKPNMATMLAYLATDACVEPAQLQTILADAVNASFNRITIDGDTSTNDSAVLVATGASGVVLQSADDVAQFRLALESLCVELAQAIVKDGEGATRFVTVMVSGGATDDECLDVAYTVAESPLVKTALFASDPNWGRILAAIGRARVPELNVDGVTLWLDDVLIAEQGGRAASYREEDGQRVMAQPEFAIKIDLGRGSCAETVWTTDLSHDYIRINAEYRS